MLDYLTLMLTYYPVRMRKGVKVIGLVVVVTPKIGISRDLGSWATRKPNKAIGFGEKLASLCFKSKETVYERQK
jgi:hypothetical protein